MAEDEDARPVAVRLVADVPWSHPLPSASFWGILTHESMKHGLTISQSAVGTVHVLKLGGFLDGHTFGELEKVLDQLIKAGKSRIVLELSGLGYIASAGVGCFIGSAQLARQAGGSVQLVNPSANVREIFSILGLSAVLEIHDNIDAGVRAARGG